VQRVQRFERRALAMRRIATAPSLLAPGTGALTPAALDPEGRRRKLAVELWDVWAGARAARWS
jgi:hypothetical protein